MHDLGDLSIDLFPTLPLRARAWELRDNMTAADAIFVALDEPLATKNLAPARAAAGQSSVQVVEL